MGSTSLQRRRVGMLFDLAAHFPAGSPPRSEQARPKAELGDAMAQIEADQARKLLAELGG